MKITHQLHYPDTVVADRIVKALNEFPDTSAKSEFIMKIPRKLLVHIDIKGDLTVNEILSLGALIGSLTRN
jgi:hypothetical protein